MDVQPMTYPEKMLAIAATFERQQSMLGKPYALQELRNALNALSNEALQEMQAMREKTDG